MANEELLEAAKAVASGQSDADLGGGVFKQRIARRGGGKSSGFRTIILFKAGGHSFFVHGFAKNAKESLGNTFLGFDAEALERASAAGEIAEVKSDGKEGKQG